MAEDDQTKLTYLHINADKGSAQFTFSIWRLGRPGTIYGEFPIAIGPFARGIPSEAEAKIELKDILLAAAAVL